ncbi:sigma-70 family RNA polymerase sigma factor [Streptomyces formicae]|uniref:RNA polymerase sigma factor n=1 Tax=Streptomyces formicae TaxID=1616117 RepID=A0ABY3WN79_9ACTN|nr:sigma-70 family RNA polymerase sigma factor [Streptomyces formicae]UNM14059.1 sigma-70 family RNA polymerase sigma factor [Streptomyces formicae]
MARDTDFASLTEPYRRELLAHCYRMLGSVHDAEDLVQETYLRAWRAYDGFEGRSSLRTWLYRIATNACLTALERGSHRPLPSGLGAPGDDPGGPLAPGQPEVPWLQPLPDALLAGGPEDPATVVASRESVRLAFVAALQLLPPRQRAILILRDVLRWRASEVAELTEATETAMNSALQRARAQLSRAAPAPDTVVAPAEPEQRELVERYATAFANADIDALMALLTDDIVFEMPPIPTWFRGREAAVRLMSAHCPVFGAPGSRLVPTAANGQPALALYQYGGDSRDGRDGAYGEGSEGDKGGILRAFSVEVHTVTASGIARIVSFQDPSLFPAFGLPLAEPAPAVR